MPQFTTSDGVRIEYTDEGQGSPVVFVHGWMMSGRFWTKQVEAFRGSHRVIVPNLRGCGGSAARPGTHNVPRFADDLHELIQHLDLQKATLVGWSMGGGITMEYLSAHGPGRTAAVALVDFPPNLEEDPSVADKVCHNLQTRKEAWSRDFLKRMFLNPVPPEEEAWMIEESAKCSPESACEMYRAMRSTGTIVHERYAVPALLVFPARGWFTKSVDQWRTMFPKAESPMFGASKHCPFLEEPEEFNRALSGLLGRADNV